MVRQRRPKRAGATRALFYGATRKTRDKSLKPPPDGSGTATRLGKPRGTSLTAPAVARTGRNPLKSIRRTDRGQTIDGE